MMPESSLHLDLGTLEEYYAGSAWYVSGTSDPGWEDALDQLRVLRVRGSDFEVLASGPVTAC